MLLSSPWTGDEQPLQLVPIHTQVTSVPERPVSLATHELVFQAAKLPPLGFRAYYVTKVSNSFVEVQPSNDTSIGDAVSMVLVLMQNSLEWTCFVEGQTELLSRNTYITIVLKLSLVLSPLHHSGREQL